MFSNWCFVVIYYAFLLLDVDATQQLCGFLLGFFFPYIFASTFLLVIVAVNPRLHEDAVGSIDWIKSLCLYQHHMMSKSTQTNKL